MEPENEFLDRLTAVQSDLDRHIEEMARIVEQSPRREFDFSKERLQHLRKLQDSLREKRERLSITADPDTWFAAEVLSNEYQNAAYSAASALKFVRAG